MEFQKFTLTRETILDAARCMLLSPSNRYLCTSNTLTSIAMLCKEHYHSLYCPATYLNSHHFELPIKLLLTGEYTYSTQPHSDIHGAQKRIQEAGRAGRCWRGR
jgi:hypothetical protein